MSNKTYTLILIGVGLFILATGFFVGWNVKPEKTCPVITNIIYVAGDTVHTPQDTLLIVKWKKIPAITNTDTAGMVSKSTAKDTLLVVDKDSIKVEATAEYFPKEDTFNMDININFRGYDSFRVDTIKINYVDSVYVEKVQPFYDTFLFGTVTGLLAAIIILLLGG